MAPGRVCLPSTSNINDYIFSNLFRTVWNEHGINGFFKGAPQRAMVFAPLFTISLLVYEVQKFYMDKFTNKP